MTLTLPDRSHLVPKPRSRGLGDTIAKFTHATRLDKVAQFYTNVTGRPCHCPERQEKLNQMFPYT